MTETGAPAERPSEASRPRSANLVLFHPVLVGMAYGVVLSLRGLLSALFESRYGGVSVPTLHRFLATEYRGEFLRAALVVLALGALIGTFLGCLGSLLVDARARWIPGAVLSPVRRLVHVSVFLLVATCLVWLDDVASRPALYQQSLYAAGGWRKWLQLITSDVFGRTGVGLVSLCLLVGWFFYPLQRVPDAQHRLRGVLKNLAIAVGAAAVSGGVVVLWSSSQRPKPTRPDAPNVLLVAADSLRADRIDQSSAPRMTELQHRSVVFDRAYTPLPRTFPAWVSILTGQWPERHGIRHMFPRWETRAQIFDTVAGRLAQNGWYTAVIGDFAADIFRRIDLGFQSLETPVFTMRELLREHLFSQNPFILSWLRGPIADWLVPTLGEMHAATDSDLVTSKALSQIDAARGRPFFLTVFYSTAHFPYAAPGADQRRFRVDGYTGPFRYAKDDTLAESSRPSPTDIAQILALYDAAVFATDRSVGELLDGVSQRGLADNTVVVILADHGEQLYENGRAQGHGDHLLGDESLRVPLIVFDPRHMTAKGPGARDMPPHHVSAPVSLVDVAPTLLEMTGQPPLWAADGRSLVGYLRNESMVPRSVYTETGLWFSETIDEVPVHRRIGYPDLAGATEVDRSRGDQVVIRSELEPLTVAAKHRMVQDEHYRLLYEPTRTGPRFLLFDMDTDRGCERDVAASYPAEVERLKEQLWRHVSADPMVERLGDWLIPRARPRTEPSP